jgi:hypothetical protein
MYTETSAGFPPSKVETQSRTEGYMFINGKVLLDLVRGDGPKEDFEDPQEYENDCFNVAKLIIYLISNGTMDDYLLGESDDEEDVTIKNQVKRVCNLYGIKL